MSWKIETSREVFEIILMHIKDSRRYDPEAWRLIESAMWGHIGMFTEEFLMKLSKRQIPKVEPDFFDDTGRPRLRLKTVSEKLNKPLKDVLENTDFKDGPDELIDALDFMRLCREKFLEGDKELRFQFVDAINIMTENAPDDIKKQIYEKSKKLTQGLGSAYVDEEGNKYFNFNDFCKHMGLSEEEAKESLEELKKQGRIEEIPFPPTDTVH